ncbi:hypothetical protein LPU83_pLPU83b_0350 (plasmid) [Rhizobium favelukesii]|uniref:Uncharacterized protein n=1 Tax=Rhizobium favelukesii TaxID=348824 RepID=W6RGI8_9HYPH|nr:hypothetical protein LPU83_pLPU83b_0350 [Rhizobium favelukesii]
MRCRSPFALLSSTSGMLHAVRRAATGRSSTLVSAFQVRPSLSVIQPIPAISHFERRKTVQQLAQFLAATGRQLCVLGKVICHFFRKGKLGLKLAIKIPFLVEIEALFETDWNRRE